MRELELYILRGLPGAGKSTLAKSISDCYFEADMYHIQKDGTYKFDPSKIKEAHEWCQMMIRTKMKLGISKVVVSNTFTTEKELEPYLKMAEKYNYRVYSLIVENRHGESETSNIHDVPKETIQKMRERFTIKL